MVLSLKALRRPISFDIRVEPCTKMTPAPTISLQRHADFSPLMRDGNSRMNPTVLTGI
jgi:hypothetical protein